MSHVEVYCSSVSVLFATSQGRFTAFTANILMLEDKLEERCFYSVYLEVSPTLCCWDVLWLTCSASRCPDPHAASLCFPLPAVAARSSGWSWSSCAPITNVWGRRSTTRVGSWRNWRECWPPLKHFAIRRPRARPPYLISPSFLPICTAPQSFVILTVSS